MALGRRKLVCHMDEYAAGIYQLSAKVAAMKWICPRKPPA
jgi:hypothetical protein